MPAPIGMQALYSFIDNLYSYLTGLEIGNEEIIIPERVAILLAEQTFQILLRDSGILLRHVNKLVESLLHCLVYLELTIVHFMFQERIQYCSFLIMQRQSLVSACIQHETRPESFNVFLNQRALQ